MRDPSYVTLYFDDLTSAAQEKLNAVYEKHGWEPFDTNEVVQTIEIYDSQEGEN